MGLADWSLAPPVHMQIFLDKTLNSKFAPSGSGHFLACYGCVKVGVNGFVVRILEAMLSSALGTDVDKQYTNADHLQHKLMTISIVFYSIFFVCVCIPWISSPLRHSSSCQITVFQQLPNFPGISFILMQTKIKRHVTWQRVLIWRIMHSKSCAQENINLKSSCIVYSWSGL